MIYRIQESIFFRDEDGRVWTDDESSVMLTATTGRLLRYLLQHKGQVVSKDELLEKVWDAYGLSTSSNSLYKYISDLRTLFKNLGYTDEFIITVPKMGFMFSKTVAVEIIEDGIRANESLIVPGDEPGIDPAAGPVSEPQEASLTPEESDPSANSVGDNPARDKSPAANRSGGGRKIALLSLTLAVLIAAVIICYQLGDSGRQNEMTWPLGNIDNCPVRSFTPHESEKSLAVLKNIIATKGMLCSGNSIYFVRVSEPVLTDKKGRIFISRCNYADGKNRNFSSCENYYRADYEITQ